MSSLGEPAPSSADGEATVCGVAAQPVETAYSCNRLGRVANPPGFSLADWLLPGRRR
ncbi:MAG: hypothetical protein K0U78_08350 [Actinomycetia bacterium]|nr:hypothetical protein [Actinomycetes bacterium]